MVKGEQQIDPWPLAVGVAAAGHGRQTRADGLDEMVREHFTALHRTAFRLTHDRGRAEDLVQDTFERACRAFDRYRPEGKARAWLGLIMRNIWIGDHRRRRSLPAPLRFEDTDLLLPNGIAIDVPGPADVESVVLDELGVASILRAIDGLPPHLRQVVMLADVQAISYATVADMLAVPIGTVASRLSRGRRRLRDALRAEACETGLLARAS